MTSEKKMQYAVLQYSPSLVSGESINVGIVVASTDEPLFKFVETKKLARVREFDDTIDIEELKKVLRAIAYELETTLENCMRKIADQKRSTTVIGKETDRKNKRVYL